MNINRPKEVSRIVSQLEKRGEKPRLLLHSCCAPCSSTTLEYLTQYFRVTLFFYNPNIYPAAEYDLRLAEQKKLLSAAPFCESVELLEGKYDPREFEDIARGLENEPEGGARCAKCFALRLTAASRAAKEGGFEWLTSTLTVGSQKNSELIISIGQRLAEQYGLRYLPGDFKKRNGYMRSVELAKEYGIYRQEYCGCRYSLGGGEK